MSHNITTDEYMWRCGTAFFFNDREKADDRTSSGSAPTRPDARSGGKQAQLKRLSKRVALLKEEQGKETTTGFSAFGKTPRQPIEAFTISLKNSNAIKNRVKQC